MRKGYSIVKHLVWFTQFGLSVAAPPVVGILGSAWLRDRFGLGGWVVALGALLGLGGAVSSLWSALRSMESQMGADDTDTGTNFNEHR